jgi:prepilin-type processing-associated H-X9-DG protein
LWEHAWAVQRQDPKGLTSLDVDVMATIIPVYLCPSELRQVGENGRGIEWGATSYLGVAGTGIYHLDGTFHRNYTVRFPDISDGTSTTLLIGERPPGPQGIFSGWYAAWGHSVCQFSQILPADRNDWLPLEAIDCVLSISPLRPGEVNNACDLNHFWSLHSGGANFAFADASVRFLSYASSPVLPALATRAGGEVVDLN